MPRTPHRCTTALPAVELALAGILATGCTAASTALPSTPPGSPVTDGAAAPGASRSPQEAPAVSITPADLAALGSPQTAIGDLTIRTSTEWSRPRVHVTWSQSPSFGAFNTLVTRQSSDLVQRFREAYTSDGGVAAPFLTGTWSPVTSTDRVLGVRLLTSEFGGASHEDSTRTLYGTADQAWQGSDLLNKDAVAQLSALLETRARQLGLRSSDAMDVETEGLVRDVSFNRQGALQLLVGSGELAEADRGMVLATVPSAISDPMLSQAGRTVRDATMTSPKTAPPQRSTSASTSPSASPVATPGRQRVDCARAKCVALTFDDGPGPYTRQIVDALARRGARATFFEVGGNVQAQPATTRHAHEAGMAIGDHSWTHPDFTAVGNQAAKDEIRRTAEQITRATGEPPIAVRPPYGAFSKSTPHDGLPFVLWDADTEDWKNRDAKQTTQRAMAGAHPGAIILMHDIHPSTAKAVPGIVDALQAKGYTLVTVDELILDMSSTGAYYSGKR